MRFATRSGPVLLLALGLTVAGCGKANGPPSPAPPSPAKPVGESSAPKEVQASVTIEVPGMT